MARTRRKRRNARPRVRVQPFTVAPSVADRYIRSRNGTTLGLIAAGRLRAVPWGRRVRILISDLERIASEGIAPDLRRPRVPRRKPTAAGVGQRILGIDLDALGEKA